MRNAIKSEYISHDCTPLAYRHWPAVRPSGKALILFHRGHEHSARLQYLVDELGFEDFDVYAWDARGHGTNAGPRGYAPDFGYFVRDAQSFFEHLQASHGVKAENTVVVAQSVGAVIASAWVHDYAPRLRALVLASPAFSVNLFVPGAVPALKLAHAVCGQFFVNSYVKGKLLTHDVERQQSYDTDPLVARPIAVNVLLELYEVSARLVADASAIRVPTLMLVSGADYVVRKPPQKKFFDNLGSSVKRWVDLEGFYHDTLGEKDREKALAPLREFVQEQFTAPAWTAVDLLNAHKSGVTYDEYMALDTHLSMFNPKGLMFGITRALLSGPGKWLSESIRIGVDTGFDSGSSLDAVYRNKATGAGPLGRFVDRQYLNAIGWRGIRQRKMNLEQQLRKAIAEVRAKGEPLILVDIAAGHGRYILDALAQAGLRTNDEVVLRDYSPINVYAGQELIKQRGLEQFVRFEHGNAFKLEELATLPRANVIVVSGLYELFPDNDMLSTSLKGLALAAAPGAQLVYTGQPWHPQMEFIARVLTSHRGGEPWVMRRRTQLELDELVRVAGFEKQSATADRWGIFTVSRAERI